MNRTLRDALYPYWLKKWIAIPVSWGESRNPTYDERRYNGPSVDDLRIFDKWVRIEDVNSNGFRTLHFESVCELHTNDPDDDNKRKLSIVFALLDGYYNEISFFMEPTTKCQATWVLYSNGKVAGSMPLSASDVNTNKSFKLSSLFAGIIETAINSSQNVAYTIKCELEGYETQSVLCTFTVQDIRNAMVPKNKVDTIQGYASPEGIDMYEIVINKVEMSFTYDGESLWFDEIRASISPILRSEIESIYETVFNIAGKRVFPITFKSFPFSIAQQYAKMFSYIVMALHPTRFPTGFEQLVSVVQLIDESFSVITDFNKPAVIRNDLPYWKTEMNDVKGDHYKMMEDDIKSLMSRPFYELTNEEAYRARDLMEKFRVLRMKHKEKSLGINCSFCNASAPRTQCGNVCGIAYYCGDECAQEHYSHHKWECAHKRKMK